MYVRIPSKYRDLVVPIKLLEKIVEEGYMARTTYENGTDTLAELESIVDISIHMDDEIKSVLAQQALEKS